MEWQLLAVVAALGTALVSGFSTSLQHHASLGDRDTSSAALMVGLARRPTWLLGLVLSGVAFVLHAVALDAGSLVVVQPIVVTAVVFAVLIRAGLDRRVPSPRELGWVLVTWAGLAVLVVASRGVADVAARPAYAGPVLGTLGGLVVLALWRAERTRSVTRRGLWLGAASGMLFGAGAVLLDLVMATASEGVLALVAGWPLWLMLVTGLGALVVNQRAYQSTRLSVSMPVLNAVAVVVALAVGALVLGQRPSGAPGVLALQVVGLVVVVAGVVRLSRDHALRDVRTSESVA